MVLVAGSVHLGLIYGLLALGVYITFRILNTPDLTVEGSFTLGLSVSAALTVAGHPFVGIVLAIVAGAGAGCVTGLLQTKLSIHPVLSGILTMGGLYTINLLVLGSRSNLSLIGTNGIFDNAFLLGLLGKNGSRTLIAALYCLLALCVLILFFKTHLGLCIRASGNNEDMVRSSSIDVDGIRIVSLAVSNAFVALSGAVLAQYQGYADISSGVGILVVGLASVIIGEVLFGRRGVTIGLVSAVSGSLIYRFIIAFALKSDFFPTYAFKLLSAIIVVIALSVPAVKQKLQFSKQKREAKRNAG